MRQTSLLILFFVLLSQLGAQELDYYLDYPRYSFIEYEQNSLILPQDDNKFREVFAQFESILSSGSGNVNIVHMGGSHIQADMYTHVMRQNFAELTPDMTGARGMVFPFRVAHTNNPSNYKVSSTGNWANCKSTRLNTDCSLGLTGIAVSTTDSLASINIDLSSGIFPAYSYNSVTIFHEPSNYSLSVIIDHDTLSTSYDTISNCSKFILQNDYTALKIYLEKQGDSAPFHLTGIVLDNDEPGIRYHAIGVNGARLSSYLRCEKYIQQLSQLKPNLVIFSIGTNDAYTRRFNKELYTIEFKQLLDRTREAAPNAAIILTVPNDSYLYKRYVNTNTPVMRNEILKLAEEYNCAIWDFYSIMGGLNSSQAWYALKIMQYDRVHFTRSGYKIKGDLFFTAFLNTWKELIPESKLFNSSKQ